MTKLKRLPLAILLTLLLQPVFVQPANVFASPRVLSPEGVFFHRFASATSGSEAIWINPAGLGSYLTSTTAIMYDWRDPGFGDDRGLFFSAQGLGYAYRKLKALDGVEDYKEHSFAFGHQYRSGLSLGGSYRYVSNGPDPYHHRHFWTLGLLYRQDVHWSLGAVFSNLNKGQLSGVKTAVEQVYSFSARPLGSPTLTLSAEIALSHKQNLAAGILRLGAEAEPMPGLKIYGSWREDDAVEFGVRVNFIRSFIGGQSRHRGKSRPTSVTTYIGTVAEPQKSISKSRQRTLHIGLSGEIYENPVRPVFGKSPLAFFDYALALYRAAKDETVSDIIITAGVNHLSWGQTQELKEAMSFCRNQGKRVTVYLADPSNRNYYLALSADQIVLAPAGYLWLTGLSVELSFLAEGLEKIGVRFETERIAEYKSAPEMVTNSEPSAENEEAINHLLDVLYDQFLGEIARGRNLSEEKARELVNGGPFTSAEAHQAGLVDFLAYPDQLAEKLPGLAKNQVGVIEYVRTSEINDDWGVKPVIAVVVAEGAIGDSSPDGEALIRGTVTPETIDRALAEALGNPRILGIALRINSPGGSAVASDLIHRRLLLAKKYTPLCVSMSGVAASGGYYLSAVGERVFTNPGTITGSIGIFALKPDLSELFAKTGIHRRQYVRGDQAGMMTLSRPFSEGERQRLRSGLRAFYNRFLEVAAAGRGLSIDSVDALGRGRVWTGAEAVEYGLADTVGGLWQAIEWLAAKSQAKSFEVKLYPKRRPLFVLPDRKLFGSLISLVSLIPGVEYLLGVGSAPNPEQLTLLATGATGKYQMRLPYTITIQ